MAEGSENIISINIEDEMRGAYIDYSMSVIVSRALPDVRDGLKPVHRRVLYGMAELGLTFNRSYKKSARIVGEVLGKYHPHGDSSVYDTMVRMAQWWSLRYQLVDGQGNFGSMDNDPPAAMRYTEARMQKISQEMLRDIDKDTVDMQPNFDESTTEPSVMPSAFPNLLVNGTSGIAVGMATNMPPHNLSECIDGIIAYINNRDIDIAGLMEHIKAPDFPTGATIYGYSGVRQAFETGRGRVVMRAKAHFETTKSGREIIVITEVPYQTNIASLVAKTGELIIEKKIDGLSNANDESGRDGIRVVFELKKDAIPEVVLNQLYKYTGLQTSFSVNNIALVNGRPKVLNLKQMIHHFVEHRHEVVIRRTKFDLDAAEKRLHILEGYLKALDIMDEIIALIRGSQSPDEAKQALVAQYEFSEIQATAILAMTLRTLTGLERDKIRDEHDEKVALVTRLKEILASESLRMTIIKDELAEIKETYGDERRTAIEMNAESIEDEDMIADDEMIITISNNGYIKRTDLREFKQQGRGGVGSKGVATKEDDYTEHMFVATNRNYLLIFTNYGKLYWIKAYKIPVGSKASKGRPLQNLLPIGEDEYVQSVINIANLNDEEFVNSHYLVMCTEKGIIKKTSLEQYSRPRSNGIIAININEGDKLLDVKMTNGEQHVVLAVASGRAIHFPEDRVRSMGRSATGVRGITLEDEHDKVVGLAIPENEESTLLVISEKGFGKRSAIEDYRITGRGGKGVKTLNISEKTGKLVGIVDAKDEDELIIITKSGITIRLAMDKLRIMGRATQGVKLIRLNDEDDIASIETVAVPEEVEEDPLLEEVPEVEPTAAAENPEATDSDSNTDEGQEEEGTEDTPVE